MTGETAERDELEKLLADVQRTIRENKLFIRNLKEEAADSEATAEVETAGGTLSEEDGFEEL